MLGIFSVLAAKISPVTAATPLMSKNLGHLGWILMENGGTDLRLDFVLYSQKSGKEHC